MSAIDVWKGYRRLPPNASRATAQLLAELEVEASEADAFHEYYQCLQAKRTTPPQKRTLIGWRQELEVAPAEATARSLVAGHAGEIEAAVDGDMKSRDALVDRIIFTAVYGKERESGARLRFADALGRAVNEHRVARACREVGSYACRAGEFSQAHLDVRLAAFPYVPACGTSHAAPTIDCLDEAGRLLGYIALSREGYIDDLSVLPAQQGRGIARRLVGAAAEQLAQLGVDVISLHCRACNHPALRLYTSLGFKLGELEFPNWYSWHGGHFLEGSVQLVAARARERQAAHERQAVGGAAQERG